MFKSALILIIGTVHVCYGSNKITIDVSRTETKTGKFPYQKFGVNMTSSGYKFPEDLKLKGPMSIPVNLHSNKAI
jgi:hypothetical protein